MELWWRVRGWIRLRLTSADCAGRLRELAREVQMYDIRFSDDLTAEFTVFHRDRERISVRDGDVLVEIRRGGLPSLWNTVHRWWMVTVFALGIIMLSVLLQGRLLFFRVEGNDRVPERLILERATECGLYFGAPSRDVRSEQVKNHLLWAIPELRWAGVNVDGCSAAITVAERQTGEEPEETLPGDIVAAIDAVVTDVFLGTGSALAAPGQAVRAGDVLISGTTDLGLLVRTEQADGEVYGLTRRAVEVKLPEDSLVRRETGRVIRKFSLRIGKKYVNFSNDCGILYGTCVKMRTVNDLKLPGGFSLPVALVTDTYRLCDTDAIPREMDAGLLLSEARRLAREDMIAGTILREDVNVEEGRLRVVFECRELIGRFRPGFEIEGDTNDRENRERGAR